MYVLERVTDPDFEPVSFEEMKQHLREFDSVDAATQAQIEGLISAGREWVEGFTGRTLVDTTWRLTLLEDVRPSDVVSGSSIYRSGVAEWRRHSEIPFRMSPLLSVISFKSVDGAGTETTVDDTTYEIREGDSKWPRLRVTNGAVWASDQELRIIFRAGFIDTSASPSVGEVPERFKQAIKLWVEAHYDRDEKMMPLLLEAATRLIRPERADISIA